MVDLYPSENLNALDLLSVRHFVYKLLFHVHLPRFGEFGSVAVNIVVFNSKSFPYLAFRSIYG